MLKIDKVPEPAFLKEFKEKFHPHDWRDYERPYTGIKDNLRRYMLENEQNQGGVFFCVYCEREIRGIKDSHVEHVRPKGKFKELFQDYNNMTASCKTKETCGIKKADKYTDDFINPLEEDPNEYFTYDELTGSIIPKSDEERIVRKSSETIEILNLNSFALTENRKEILVALNEAKENGYLESILEHNAFSPSLTQFYKENFNK